LGARVVELVPGQRAGEWAGDTAHDDTPPAAATPIDAAADSAAGDATAAPTVVPVKAMDERADDIKVSSRSPFLASLNPVFRLGGAFLASLPLLLSLDWVSAAVALLLEFIVLGAMRLTPWRVVRSTWPIFIGAPGSALAVLLYGKAGGDIWWQWGWINVTDRSAELALATGLRILAIGIPAIIAVLGIDATDLADGFSQLLHLPDRFVYGGLAGMRLFSVLQDDWGALTASRRSRGLGDDSKVKSFFPQAFALLVLSIRRSTTLAVAMQARGFGGDGPRSHARVSHVHARDWWFLAGCLAIPVVALVCAAWGGTFSFMGN
ncbi:MAG: energy-coupling factor transporter transmembrane component T, partial [Bifidobacterium sp.]|nr:energy-coupling factor transporter transmembrane component T [Bifidobacterium sp.]